MKFDVRNLIVFSLTSHITYHIFVTKKFSFFQLFGDWKIYGGPIGGANVPLADQIGHLFFTIVSGGEPSR